MVRSLRDMGISPNVMMTVKHHVRNLNKMKKNTPKGIDKKKHKAV